MSCFIVYVCVSTDLHPSIIKKRTKYNALFISSNSLLLKSHYINFPQCPAANKIILGVDKATVGACGSCLDRLVPATKFQEFSCGMKQN